MTAHFQTPEDYIRHASTLADLLIDRYSNSDGLLSRRGDVVQGTIMDTTPLIDEWGDYVQYIHLLGVISKNERYTRWAFDQIAKSISLYAIKPPLFLLPPLLKGKNIFNALRIGDTLWGLMHLYCMTNNAELEQWFDAFTTALERYCVHHKGLAYFSLIIGNRAVYKFPLSEPTNTGYYLESLVHMYQRTKKSRYLDSARTMMKAWLEDTYFQEHKLFRRLPLTRSPLIQYVLDLQFKLRHKHPLNATMLVKGDTYLIFTLLALYQVTGEEQYRQAIMDWKNALLRTMRAPDGRFYNYYYPKTQQRWSIDLGENHSVIEALIDIYQVLHDDTALTAASLCAKQWIAQQQANGLYAEHQNSTIAHLDPQNDLTVDLLKLYELTKDQSFLDAAHKNLQTVMELFQAPYGLCQTVQLSTATPGSSITETKFMGLAIKALLVWYYYQKDGSIMDSPDKRLLTADR